MALIDKLAGVKRRLLNVLAALSLIFCVTTCILWARNSDSFRMPATTGFRQVIFASGTINYDRIEYLPRLQGRALITHHLSISCWMLAFALALPVLVREALFGYFAKPPKDHCQICGYDLRATPNRCPECGTFALSN